MIAECQPYAVLKSLIFKGIFLSIALFGCASQPRPVPSDVQFTITGKFGIQQGEQGYSANFNWQQLSRGYDIEVWGPLGQGRTRLQGDAARMQVLKGDELLAEGSPHEVMYAHLGWSIPIEVLPAWIRGVPEESLAFAAAVYDDEGRLTQFDQAGWQVAMNRYTQRGQYATPGRIRAVNGAKKVTVIVREYSH